MTRRRLLLLAFALLAIVVGWRQFGTHNAPAGQPPLAYLDAASLAALKADFNRDADKTRVIALLAPT